MIFIRTVLIFFMMSGLVFAQSPHHQVIKKSSLHITLTETVPVRYGSIEVTYYGVDELRADDVINLTSVALERYFTFMDYNNIQYTKIPCQKIDLDIYEIKDSQLNNVQIMNFLDWSLWNFEPLYGIYDSKKSEKGIGSVFVSRDVRNQKFRNMILVHEISHYIQDSYCVPGDLETISSKFESYVIDYL